MLHKHRFCSLGLMYVILFFFSQWGNIPIIYLDTENLQVLGQSLLFLYKNTTTGRWGVISEDFECSPRTLSVQILKTWRNYFVQLHCSLEKMTREQMLSWDRLKVVLTFSLMLSSLSHLSSSQCMCDFLCCFFFTIVFIVLPVFQSPVRAFLLFPGSPCFTLSLSFSSSTHSPHIDYSTLACSLIAMAGALPGA